MDAEFYVGSGHTREADYTSRHTIIFQTQVHHVLLHMQRLLIRQLMFIGHFVYLLTLYYLLHMIKQHNMGDIMDIWILNFILGQH